MTTGEKIRLLREQKGLTQEQLGAMVGVQNAAIHKYENGRVVNLKRSTIDKLAAALNTTPAYLMGWSEDNVPLHEDLLKDPRIFNLINALIQLPPEKRERFLDALNTQLELLLPPSSDQ
jgi:transcriptional regulator with XRE-family HTH domain